MADLNLTTSAATVAAGLLLLLLLASQRGALLAQAGDAAPVALDDGEAEQGQGGAAFEVAAALASVDVFGSGQADGGQEARNLAAFLAMIRKAEGTADEAGYRRMFGGALFDDFSDHPRRAIAFTDKTGQRLYTTAAGAYQFMAVSITPTGMATKVNTWDRLKAKLYLQDFSPASQDEAAIELIREAGALGDVQAGWFDDAVAKVRRIWASMPGAGYNQPERRLDDLRAVYINAGGVLA